MWTQRLLKAVCSVSGVACLCRWNFFPCPTSGYEDWQLSSICSFLILGFADKLRAYALLFCCPSATVVTAVTQASRGTIVSWISWSVPLNPVWTVPRVWMESKTTAVPVGQVGQKSILLCRHVGILQWRAHAKLPCWRSKEFMIMVQCDFSLSETEAATAALYRPCQNPVDFLGGKCTLILNHKIFFPFSPFSIVCFSIVR